MLSGSLPKYATRWLTTTIQLYGSRIIAPRSFRPHEHSGRRCHSHAPRKRIPDAPGAGGLSPPERAPEVAGTLSGFLTDVERRTHEDQRDLLERPGRDPVR